MPITERKQGVNGTYLNLYPNSTYDPTRWERVGKTVDIIIVRVEKGVLKVLMIRRANNPDEQCDAYPGCLAIPGGFLNVNQQESLVDAAYRELEEETGVKNVSVRQLITIGNASRDPRWYMDTTVYYALLNEEQAANQKVVAGDDAASYEWIAFKDINKLANKNQIAFDHGFILQTLYLELVDRLWRYPDAFSLLPGKFTWTELQSVYEAILRHKLVAPNFRSKIKLRYKLHQYKDTNQGKCKGRPAALFSYKGER